MTLPAINLYYSLFMKVGDNEHHAQVVGWAGGRGHCW